MTNNVLEVIGALPITDSNKKKLLDLLGLYLFSHTSVNTLVATLAEYDPKLDRVARRELREHLKHDGMLHSSVRLYLYACVSAKASGSRVPPAPSDLDGIYINFTKVVLNRNSSTYALLWSFATRPLPCLPLAEVQKKITEVLHGKDFLTYCGKFIGAKMRFITQSGVTTPAEIRSELITAAMYACMRAYPEWRDSSHLIALSKRAAHNAGVNIIEKYAAKKRVAVQQAMNGNYSARVLSLNEDSERTFDVTELSTMAVEASPYELLEQIQHLDSLSEWQREYLHLLIGQDEDFSNKLGVPCLDDARNARSFDSYNSAVCKYLNLCVETTMIFLRSLKPLLA